jgi:amino acid transporter
MGAAGVAFFAFVGFEDTVNVAEEVKDPSRAIPRAILIALAVALVLYVLVAVAALVAVPIGDIGGSKAPLLLVLERAGVALPGGLFPIIALLAVGNTGLLNLIMASRLTYGMAREGLLPPVLARVHPKRRTPWVAVWVAFGLAAALAASGGVRELAETTALLLLLVFATLHVALIVIQRRLPADGSHFHVPRVVPAIGLLLCGALMLTTRAEIHLRALIVLLIAGGLYVLLGRRYRASHRASI